MLLNKREEDGRGRSRKRRRRRREQAAQETTGLNSVEHCTLVKWTNACFRNFNNCGVQTSPSCRSLFRLAYLYTYTGGDGTFSRPEKEEIFKFVRLALGCAPSSNERAACSSFILAPGRSSLQAATTSSSGCKKTIRAKRSSIGAIRRLAAARNLTVMMRAVHRLGQAAATLLLATKKRPQLKRLRAAKELSARSFVRSSERRGAPQARQFEKIDANHLTIWRMNGSRDSSRPSRLAAEATRATLCEGPMARVAPFCLPAAPVEASLGGRRHGQVPDERRQTAMIESFAPQPALWNSHSDYGRPREAMAAASESGALIAGDETHLASEAKRRSSEASGVRCAPVRIVTTMITTAASLNTGGSGKHCQSDTKSCFLATRAAAASDIICRCSNAEAQQNKTAQTTNYYKRPEEATPVVWRSRSARKSLRSLKKVQAAPRQGKNLNLASEKLEEKSTAKANSMLANGRAASSAPKCHYADNKKLLCNFLLILLLAASTWTASSSGRQVGANSQVHFPIEESSLAETGVRVEWASGIGGGPWSRDGATRRARVAAAAAAVVATEGRTSWITLTSDAGRIGHNEPLSVGGASIDYRSPSFNTADFGTLATRRALGNKLQRQRMVNKWPTTRRAAKVGRQQNGEDNCGAHNDQLRPPQAASGQRRRRRRRRTRRRPLSASTVLQRRRARGTHFDSTKRRDFERARLTGARRTQVAPAISAIGEAAAQWSRAPSADLKPAQNGSASKLARRRHDVGGQQDRLSKVATCFVQLEANESTEAVAVKRRKRAQLVEEEEQAVGHWSSFDHQLANSVVATKSTKGQQSEFLLPGKYCSFDVKNGKVICCRYGRAQSRTWRALGQHRQQTIHDDEQGNNDPNKIERFEVIQTVGRSAVDSLIAGDKSADTSSPPVVRTSSLLSPSSSSSRSSSSLTSIYHNYSKHEPVSLVDQQLKLGQLKLEDLDKSVETLIIAGKVDRIGPSSVTPEDSQEETSEADNLTFDNTSDLEPKRSFYQSTKFIEDSLLSEQEFKYYQGDNIKLTSDTGSVINKPKIKLNSSDLANNLVDKQTASTKSSHTGNSFFRTDIATTPVEAIEEQISSLSKLPLVPRQDEKLLLSLLLSSNLHPIAEVSIDDQEDYDTSSATNLLFSPSILEPNFKSALNSTHKFYNKILLQQQQSTKENPQTSKQTNSDNRPAATDIQLITTNSEDYDSTRVSSVIDYFGDMIEKSYLLTLVLGLVILVTFAGNVLVCLSVIKVRKLRHPSNYLLISLAISDLCVACVVMPFGLYVSINDNWQLGKLLCNVYVVSDVTSCTASILNLCVISIDRYFAITRPLTYCIKRTTRTMMISIGGVWILACLISVPPLLTAGNEYGTESEPRCEVSQAVWYQLYATCMSFYIPLIVMICLYYNIYKAAKRVVEAEHRATTGLNVNSNINQNINCNDNNNQVVLPQVAVPSSRGGGGFIKKMTTRGKSKSKAKQQSSNCGKSSHKSISSLTKLPSLPTFVNHFRGSSAGTGGGGGGGGGGNAGYDGCGTDGDNGNTVQLNNPISHRTPSSSLMSSSTTNKTSSAMRERKASVTLGVIMSAFTICWLPFFIIALLRPFSETVNSLPRAYVLLTLWLGYANSLLNPIIYVTFHHDFRNAFKHLLCLRCMTINEHIRKDEYESQYGETHYQENVRKLRCQQQNQLQQQQQHLLLSEKPNQT